MYKIIELSEVDSTNNYASQLLGQNKVECDTVIWAHNQTQGRGQQGNTWNCEPEKNLTFSLVLLPKNLLIVNQFYLLQAISLAVCSFLSALKIDALVKWPNDIYVGDNKIAGILIENSCMANKIHSSVIGVGLNINQIKFDPNIPNPTSIKLELENDFEIEHLLLQLLSSIEKYLNILSNLNFGKLKTDYLSKLYRFGRESVFEANGHQFTATIIDVSETGELLLRNTANIEYKFMFKEVALIS